MLGLSEHNLSINHTITKTIQQVAKHHYKHQRIQFASTPLDSKSSFKPGGMGIILHHELVSRLAKVDQDKMGKMDCMHV